MCNSLWCTSLLKVLEAILLVKKSFLYKLLSDMYQFSTDAYSLSDAQHIVYSSFLLYNTTDNHLDLIIPFAIIGLVYLKHSKML